MFEKEILRLERRIAKSGNKQIVFFGSSSIRLWVRMSDDLAPFEVLNLGFGGSTFEWMNYYYGRLFENLSPVHIIMYAGDNDMSNGYSPKEIMEQVDILNNKILSQFPDATVHGISVKPSPHREAFIPQILTINEMLSSYFEGRVINIFDSMLSPSKKPMPELFLSDGLHLNAAGYKIWQKEVYAYLKKIGA